MFEVDFVLWKVSNECISFRYTGNAINLVLFDPEDKVFISKVADEGTYASAQHQGTNFQTLSISENVKVSLIHLPMHFPEIISGTCSVKPEKTDISDKPPTIHHFQGTRFSITKAQFKNISTGQFNGKQQQNQQWKKLKCKICQGNHTYLLCRHLLKIQRVQSLPQHINKAQDYCLLCTSDFNVPTRGHYSDFCPYFELIHYPY